MNGRDPGRDPALAKANAKARLRRGMYLLPSLFTVGNIALGYYSITETLKAITGDAHTHLDWAAIAIIFAIPFDSLDGRIARMTNTTSEFGKELDSLADAITFGIAPSLLALIWGFHFLPDTINHQLLDHLHQAGAFICFLFLIGGVSRLARFNISHDAQPRNPGRPGRKYFIGMPIPAAAGFLASTVHLSTATPCSHGGLLFPGCCWWASADSSWSAHGASGPARRSTSPAAIHSRSCLCCRSLSSSRSSIRILCSSPSGSLTCFRESGRGPRIRGRVNVGAIPIRYRQKTPPRLRPIHCITRSFQGLPWNGPA